MLPRPRLRGRHLPQLQRHRSCIPHLERRSRCPQPTRRTAAGCLRLRALQECPSTRSGSAYLTLPSNTLLFRAEGLRVGVVKDGRAQLVPVTIAKTPERQSRSAPGFRLATQSSSILQTRSPSGQQVKVAARPNPTSAIRQTGGGQRSSPPARSQASRSCYRLQVGPRSTSSPWCPRTRPPTQLHTTRYKELIRLASGRSRRRALRGDWWTHLRGRAAVADSKSRAGNQNPKPAEAPAAVEARAQIGINDARASPCIGVTPVRRRPSTTRPAVPIFSAANANKGFADLAASA